MQRQHLQAFFLDVVFFEVDLRVAGDHFLGELGVALLERPDGLMDRFLHGSRQPQQVALEIIEIAFEVFGHGSGEWRVVSGEW